MRSRVMRSPSTWAVCVRKKDGEIAQVVNDITSPQQRHRIWRLPEWDRKLLVVAHEGTNALIVSHLLGIQPTPWEWMRFSSRWAGITRLRTAPVASGAVWVLDSFNECGHLRPE